MIPVISVLKMISYLDRPQERERDLGDLAHVLSLYEENSGRRFDDAVLAADIEYDRMARSGPGLWKRDPAEGIAFIAAMERGLTIPQPRG